MPRKPRKKRKIRQDLTAEQIMHLFHGWILDNPNHPFYKFHGDMQFPFKDEEHRKELYFNNKDFLFSLEGKEVEGVFAPLEKGETPKAFFDYEASLKKKRTGPEILRSSRL